MFSKKTTALVAGAMAMGFAAPAMASEAELAAQLAKVQQKLAALEQAQSQDWLNERRAEEVKGLISDVLADADARATLLQDGILAGHDGKKFFLKSADGSFKMNIGGQIQFRYMANFLDDRDNETLHAFQVRRAKLKFSGKVNDEFGFKLTLGTSRNDGSVSMENAAVSWKYDDKLTVVAGIDKLPFLQEELTSSSKLLGVERSSVTEFFTLNIGTFVGAKYDVSDNVKVAIAAGNDTASDKNGYVKYGEMAGDIALTGRVDMKLAGDWSQAKDYVAWMGDDRAWFAGAALNYQRVDRDVAPTALDGDYFGWTMDTLYKANQWMANLAVNGAHFFADDATADANYYGVLAQLAYNMDDKIQPFVRYEWMDLDGADQIQGATVGVNYFLAKHNAKITTDLVWFFKGMDNGIQTAFGENPFSDSLGLNNNSADFDNNDLVVARAQFQLAF
ncbi:Phosphate-selective porin O and P [Poriferisphaera corsica]|uniref:Phosphate-selective porin O and P n=1 Tax=Poriferisphaera corsica TaxID=2528020 RepID=A0A517YQG6_9BACT|nr:porin [Poriferisphaera corsica]QDU32457.1 Phosphate-selective porin O and P [Poriferisphaera corsica]